MTKRIMAKTLQKPPTEHLSEEKLVATGPSSGRRFDIRYRVDRHLSTRLVWHDRAWDGHICDHPGMNTYCIVQQHIRDGRDDEHLKEFEEYMP
jgi:hypothetical protein